MGEEVISLMSDILLQTAELRKTFGGLMALVNLTFTVEEGQIKAIIGPNGAGKTTLFNVITGMLPSTEGRVTFKGKGINGSKAHEIAAMGISRTFQTVEIFKNMSVMENVMVGRHSRTRSGILRAGLRLWGVRSEEREILKEATEWLEFVGLNMKANDNAGSLPLGDQKLLEMARALATEPDLLLLDEPASGLNEVETEKVAQLIYQIRDRGTTVLLVEHDMDLVMKISEEILVLNYGEKIAEGSPEEVKNDQRVIDAYLGEEIDYA
jgi:branched-chain amino acid transport system ATP-binding protein